MPPDAAMQMRNRRFICCTYRRLRGLQEDREAQCEYYDGYPDRFSAPRPEPSPERPMAKACQNPACRPVSR
jgi:hypothetical protein